MSDVTIFSIGSLMFIATTWVTISFGLSRMHELRHRELEEAGVRVEVQPSGLTEIYTASGREPLDAIDKG